MCLDHVKTCQGPPPPIVLWVLVPTWYKAFPTDHIEQTEINDNQVE